MSEILPRLFASRAGLSAAHDAQAILRLPAHGGVVALTTEDGVLVQLLATASIRRAVAQRMYADPEPTRRAQFGGVVRQVWWQPAYSGFEAGLLYLQRARQLLGPKYAKSRGFAPVWYAAIDPGARHPRWQVTDAPASSPAAAAGPFATRKQCAAFVADLEDLFDLCRYHEELTQAPHGTRCAYFDMGKCPAPCDGTVSLDFYRARILESVQFATGDGAGFIAQGQQLMEQAAAELAFERAQHHRDALTRARAAQSRAGRFAASAEGFRFLIVQRGARRGWVRPFFCDRGLITCGCDAPLTQISAAAVSWASLCASSDKQFDISPEYRAECIALICHYLGKAESAAGLYLHAQIARSADEIVQHVQARFSRNSRA
jgi:DNA polymerase-3 subunit epsilon